MNAARSGGRGWPQLGRPGRPRQERSRARKGGPGRQGSNSRPPGSRAQHAPTAGAAGRPRGRSSRAQALRPLRIASGRAQQAAGVTGPARRCRPLRASQAALPSASNKKAPTRSGAGAGAAGRQLRSQQCGDCSDSVAPSRSAQSRPVTPLPSCLVQIMTLWGESISRTSTTTPSSEPSAVVTTAPINADTGRSLNLEILTGQPPQINWTDPSAKCCGNP